MPAIIGSFLGRYKILEELGHGGMATVYKAIDPRLSREVAIKLVLPEREHSEHFLKRFEREARALAQLSHPNIVKVLDYGEQDGIPFLVMEYIPGGTLKQQMGQPVNYQKAAGLLAPLAKALAYAHGQRIIHRDIKPANILLTRSGEPMLSDFGIAKLLDSQETSDLTATGVGLGTPVYMAPEQGLGQEIDHRADIYSLGVVFYELITGRQPYTANTPMAILHKQLTEPFVRPANIVPGIPHDVETVLQKALAKDREQRYQSMSDFAEALEAVAVSRKLEKKKEKKTSKTGLWLGGAAVALLGICVISGIVFGILYLKNKNAARTAQATQADTIPASLLESETPTLHPTSTELYVAPVDLPSPSPQPVFLDSPIFLTYTSGSTYENSNADVYVIDENGNGRSCIACNSCYEGEASISPDGRFVVYQSACSGSGTDLNIVSINGGALRSLTSSSSLSEREPAFSPDGEQVVYRASPTNVDRNLNGELYIIDSDGSSARSLGIEGRGPSWSPDGGKLAYMSNESGVWQIYVYEISSSRSKKVTNCTVNCRWPAWSPDGKYIAYSTTPSAGSMDPDSIWYIPSDGSSSAVMVYDVQGGAGRPAWSANGRIAFNTKNGIEIIEPDGSNHQVLVSDQYAYAASWSR